MSITKLLLSSALLFSSMGMFADEFTVTYEPTSFKAVSLTSGDAPDGSTASYAKTGPGGTYTTMIKGDTTRLKLLGYDGMTIKSVTLKMKSNKSSGAGSLSITCGNAQLATIANASFANKAWAGGYTQNMVDVTPDFTQYVVGEDETFTIEIVSSQNSLYCSAYTITYDDSQSFTPDKTTVAAIASTYSSKLYAMSADDLSAVEVATVNGKIIADADLKETLTWKIYDIDANAIIRSNSGKYLAYDGSSLCLDNSRYEWDIDEANNSWQKSGSTFAQYNNEFIYTPTSNIGTTDFQSDYTKAYPITEGYERTGLTVDKLATICLPCGVGENDFSGAVFYEIVGVVKATDDMAVDDITGLVVKEVKSLVAGKPYLMQPTSTTLIAAYDDTSEENPVSAIGMVGNLSGAKTYVAASDDTHWNYIVNNNQLRKVVKDNTASIANNRAYINLYGVPRYNGDVASAKVITLYDEASGVNALSADNDSSPLFSIDGTKANPSQIHNGIYIKDGKKCIVK